VKINKFVVKFIVVHEPCFLSGSSLVAAP